MHHPGRLEVYQSATQTNKLTAFYAEKEKYMGSFSYRYSPEHRNHASVSAGKF